MSDGRERRQEYRFSHGNLQVNIAYKYGWGLFKKQSVATWKDFNHTGMAFISERRFQLGQRLSLHLLMRDREREELQDVTAIVRNIHEMTGYYRHGVEFDFLSEEHMRLPLVKEKLITIEKKLKSILSELETKHSNHQ